jgi:predicted nucleic acid-binding protein
MILYLGATSLVKLYADEIYSAYVRDWVEQAEMVVTCRVAYTQIMAAIDSRFRKDDISREDYELLINAFSKDWVNYVTVDFDEYETGNLIQKYGLKRMAAIHLSAAKLIKKELGNSYVRFSSANQKLNKVAAVEGLRVLTFPSGEPSGG